MVAEVVVVGGVVVVVVPMMLMPLLVGLTFQELFDFRIGLINYVITEVLHLPRLAKPFGQSALAAALAGLFTADEKVVRLRPRKPRPNP